MTNLQNDLLFFIALKPMEALKKVKTKQVEQDRLNKVISMSVKFEQRSRLINSLRAIDLVVQNHLSFRSECD